MKSSTNRRYYLPGRINFQVSGMLISLVLTSTSCVTYRVASFQNRNTIENKIPNLMLKRVEYNMETFYAPKVIRICRNDSLYVPGFEIPQAELNRELSNIEYGIRLRGTNHKDTTFLKSRYDEMFIGKKKDFQEGLIYEQKALPLEDISPGSSYFKSLSLDKLFIKSCPTNLPYGTVNFRYNYSQMGFYNNTLPDLISDICSIYKYEFKENICKDSDIKGYAVLKLLSGEEKNSGLSLIFLSGITLYSLSFLGFPLVVQTNSLELGLDIYSLDDRLVASYKSFAKSSVGCAMYWGYSMRGARTFSSNYQLPRAANSKTFIKAFSVIKKQISDDADKITAELLKAH